MTRNRITLTVEETGEMLGISRALAYDLVRRGEIPSVRLGRRIVVPIPQLQALLAGDDLRLGGLLARDLLGDVERSLKAANK